MVEDVTVHHLRELAPPKFASARVHDAAGRREAEIDERHEPDPTQHAQIRALLGKKGSHRPIAWICHSSNPRRCEAPGFCIAMNLLHFDLTARAGRRRRLIAFRDDQTQSGPIAAGNPLLLPSDDILW